MRELRARLCLALLILVTGCSGKRAVVSDWPASLDYESALSRLTERGRAPVLVDGVVGISGRSQGSRLGGKAVVIVEPGGRLYFESIGKLAFVMTSNGEEIRVLFPNDKQWIRTPATAESVNALIGVPVAPDELGALIAGIGASPRVLATARPIGGGRLEVDGGFIQLTPEGEIVSGRRGPLVYQRNPERDTIKLMVSESELSLNLKVSGRRDAEPRPDLFFSPVPPDSFVELSIHRLRWPVLLPVRDTE